MSRIGKKPVALAGATVKVNGREISVNGKGGTLTYEHRPEVSVRVDDDAKEVVVERHGDSRTAKAMHGLTRSLVANMIEGVTKGYEVNLEIHGVGYGGTVQGNKVNLKLGFADTRVVHIPAGGHRRGQEQFEPHRAVDQRHRQATRRPNRLCHPPAP
ncbi:MAG: 50S ribosomal protein L6 [Planctomycetota bacterium]